jgi:hypothetical protein
MSTSIMPRDLTKEAPHSPRHRIAGFVIASRAVDKCRASVAGKLGEYRYDCPLDKMLFNFKGITGEQFKTAVQAATEYEQVGAWLQANGTAKTAAEIKTWSDQMETASLMKDPKKRSYFIESCSHLGLNPQMNTTFDWLEADDRETFRRSLGMMPSANQPEDMNQIAGPGPNSHNRVGSFIGPMEASFQNQPTRQK